MFVIKRAEENPILTPDRDHHWESFATFNLCPIKKGKTIYGVYRAMNMEDKLRTPHQMSVVGIGKSTDGIHFKNREMFITPKEEWDQYGCEDPRVTFFEGKYYIFYTALSRYPLGPEGIKVAVAVSKDLKKVDERHYVTPFNAKAMTLFPNRINGKIVVIFSAYTDTPNPKTTFAFLDEIEELWSPVFWENWQKNIDNNLLDLRRKPYDHVEVGAPPLKTKYGWLLVYSHIQNYFANPENSQALFGIEAVLLDLKNPQKIIGRTKGPFISPREQYELSGYVSNVVFPSGALIEKNNLFVYYGASDTTSCVAKVNLNDFLKSISFDYRDEFYFKRYLGNPILLPDPKNPFESKAVFNPASILLKGKTHILYRAMSEDNTSTLGYAMSEDGFELKEKLDYPVYIPREDFEVKKINNANSGCEDPRITKIGKNIYICYTAFDGVGPPRVAVSYIKETDFINKNWNWSKPFLITPRDLDDKDTCLFPKKFKDGYCVIHRVNNEICLDYIHTLDLSHEMVKKCVRVIGPRRNMWDSAKVGMSTPPIETKYGWLVIYHGVSQSHSTYRLGAVLLDLKDPGIVLARSTDVLFEPEEIYEKVGIVNNVVFPCGHTIKDGNIYIYYGGADKVIGVATMKLDIIVKALVRGSKF